MESNVEARLASLGMLFERIAKPLRKRWESHDFSHGRMSMLHNVVKS